MYLANKEINLTRITSIFNKTNISLVFNQNILIMERRKFSCAYNKVAQFAHDVLSTTFSEVTYHGLWQYSYILGAPGNINGNHENIRTVCI